MPDTRPDPRAVALALLETVLDRGTAFDLALETEPRLHELEPRDRGFARVLAATVLRQMGCIDAAIDVMLEKPQIQNAVRHILRLGVVQLKYLGTPPHAAISTSVDLCAWRMPHMKGLVNAVLRRHEDMRISDSPGARLPQGLWRRWVATYGEATANAIAAASLVEAPLDLTAKADPAAVAVATGGTVMPMGTVRILSGDTGGPVTALPGFEAGAWWVQDLSSSLPVKLMGNVAGKGVFDLCAAPGGKTAQLAATGATVTVVDRSEPRLKRLRENMTRLGLSVEVVCADAATWTPSSGLADAILLDAPCLATGTLRRHPDIPWVKSKEDMARLTALQARLLDHATTLLKPGGQLIYCTCSLEPEEGEQQIAGFLERTHDTTLLPFTAADLPGLEMCVTPEGFVRALPQYLGDRGGMDGFFIARLVKT